MEVVQSSVLGRLLLPVWLWLRARYEYSLLARVLRGIAQAWSRACAGSVLIQFVTREAVCPRLEGQRPVPDFNLPAQYSHHPVAEAVWRLPGGL